MEFSETRPLYLLAEVAKILRSENGCAWDKEQTPQSLKPYLIEETYELYDAIARADTVDTKEELGDLLYQIYAHAQIAMEEGNFDIDDVAAGITEKLIGRHPHVFGDIAIDDADEVARQWEEIKKKEKAHRESVLDGVPPHLPALLKAYRTQQKVARLGFDWDDFKDVVAKLDEEVAEFKEAVEQDDLAHMEDEAGDILFSLVNILRYKKINPEEALQSTVRKFSNRFRHVEKRCAETGRDIKEFTLEELDQFWEEAKKLST